jgi:uncharacterized protein
VAEKPTAPPPATLTITFGPSGSGKTTASKALLVGDPQATRVRVRSDVERKRLFGLGADADSGGAIYTPEATFRTYGRLLDLAADVVAHGWSAIVDAAFLKHAERQAFRALAARLGAPFGILACDAPAEELRRRLRARNGDASEATVAVLEQQLAWLEPLDAEERSVVVPAERQEAGRSVRT